MPATETKATQPRRVDVAALADLPPGTRKIVQADRQRIGVFNIAGTFYAALDVCPHERAPVCEGKCGGTNKPSAVGRFDWDAAGCVLACPWHGWEFDLRDGKSLHDPRCRLKTYRTVIEDGRVFVLL